MFFSFRLVLMVQLIFLLLYVSPSKGHAQQATLLYFNDGHEISPVVDELGQRGGVARLKTVVDQVKADDPQTVVLFGGDLGGGRLFGAVYHGFPMVEAFNLLPLDYATFGQHDFDFGPDVTRELVAASEFQWLTSNLVEADGEPFAGLPRAVVIKRNGLSIALLGLTDAMNTTSIDTSVIQQDLVKAARTALEELPDPKPDAIIALTQTGRDTNEKLLTEMSEIDAIFTEEMFEHRSNIYYVDERPVMAPCGNMGSAIQLDIQRQAAHLSLSVRVHAIDERVGEDAALARLQQHYQQKLETDLAQPIATLLSDLVAGINSDFRCRWAETGIGNLITDAYRAHHQADVALMNGGGIRDNIAAGQFTMKDALSILPFGNTVCLVEISGETLRQALEHGLRAVERNGGGFLHISGGRYEYDWSRPPGDRLRRVEIGGEPLDRLATYRIALPSYLLAGGDDFTMFRDANILVGPDAARKDVAVLIDYCRDSGDIDPAVEGRIAVLNRD